MQRALPKALTDYSTRELNTAFMAVVASDSVSMRTTPCDLWLSSGAMSQTGRQFCVAYLTHEPNVGVCNAPNGFDLLEHHIIRLVRAPHEVGYEECRAAGNTLRTMNEHLAPFAHGCLQQHQLIVVQAWKLHTWHNAEKLVFRQVDNTSLAVAKAMNGLKHMLVCMWYEVLE